MKPDYDTTVARIAGNILPGLLDGEYIEGNDEDQATYAREAVALARAVVAEVRRTMPVAGGAPLCACGAAPAGAPHHCAVLGGIAPPLDLDQ